jgi:hypothetical protein
MVLSTSVASKTILMTWFASLRNLICVKFGGAFFKARIFMKVSFLARSATINKLRTPKNYFIL